MINNSLLNTSPLNDQLAVSALPASGFDDIMFNGLSLQSSSIISTDIKDSSAPDRELSTYKTPRSDGGGFIADYFRTRVITVSGYVKASTAAELEALLDEIKRRLILREGNLDRKISGEVRRIKATLSNPEQMFRDREGYHVTFCPFTFEFTSLEPMWHDMNYTSQTKESVISLSFSEVMENLGTYKAPSDLVIIVEAAVAVTAINFKNNTNGDEISITNALVAGDILEIDGENKQVLLNGVTIDYDGVFPELEYGSNNYTLTVTGTSIQYTSTIKVKQAYL